MLLSGHRERINTNRRGGEVCCTHPQVFLHCNSQCDGVLGCRGPFETGQTRIQENTENISIRVGGDLLSRGKREFADAYNVPTCFCYDGTGRPMGRH